MALAENSVKRIDIAYSRVLSPVDRNGFPIPQAAVGGRVHFEGSAPAYVSMLVGGQVYNQPTDRLGYFSFFVYTAGAGQYTLEAWMPEAVAAEGTVSKVTVTQPLQ